MNLISTIRTLIGIVLMSLVCSNTHAQLLGGKLMLDSLKSDTAFISLVVWQNCSSSLVINHKLEYKGFDSQQKITNSGTLSPYDSLKEEDGCEPCYSKKQSYQYRLFKDSLISASMVELIANPSKRDSTLSFVLADKTEMLLNTSFSSFLFGNSLNVEHIETQQFRAIQNSTTSIAQLPKIFGLTYDSLRANLVAPITNGLAPVTYPNGFSASAPLPFFGSPNSHLPRPRGFHSDTIGNLWFQPSQQGNGILCWEFYAYKNGQKILTWRKEQCLKIFSNKHNSSPYLTGKNGTISPSSSDYEVPVCDARDSTHFFVIKDQNANDSVSVKILHSSGGVVIEKSTDTLYFYLSASKIANVSSAIIQLNDQSCEEGAKNSYTINFGSYKKPKYLVSTSFLSEKRVELKAKEQSGVGKNPKWQIAGQTLYATDTTVNLNRPGKYAYSFSAFGPGDCNYEISDSLQTAQFPYVEILLLSNDSICHGDSVLAMAKWFNSIDTPKLTWNNIDSNRILYNKSVTNTQKIILRALFSDSSQHSDTILIEALAPPKSEIEINKALACLGDTGSYVAISDSGTTYSWTLNQEFIGNDSVVSVTGFGNLNLESRSPLGCVSQDKITVEPKIFPPNNVDSIAICPENDLVFTLAGFSEFNYNLELQDSIWRQTTAEVSIPDFKAERTIFLHIEKNTDDNYCKWKDSVRVGLKSIQKFTVLGDTAICRNSSPVDLKDDDFISPNNGSWFDSNIPIKALKNGRYLDPSLVKTSRSLYSINYTTIHPTTKCRYDENVRFVLIDPPNPKFLVDSIKLCAGSEDVLLNQGTYATPSNGVWKGKGVSIGADNLYYFQPSQVAIGENIALVYELTGENNCVSHDTVSSIVSLYPNPKASINFSIAPRTISFSDQRENISCEVNKWFWDFLDPFADPCTTSVVVQEDELFCRYSISPNPPHRFRKSGIYSIKLVVEDSIKGLKDSVVKRNYLHLISSTGVSEPSADKISLSPNPAQSSTLFKAENPEQEYTMRIVNSSGKILKIAMVKDGTIIQTPWTKGFYTVIISERESAREQFLNLIIK